MVTGVGVNIIGDDADIITVVDPVQELTIGMTPAPAGSLAKASDEQEENNQSDNSLVKS